ncbi:hypothetical protein M527_06365 [Sphingobium indicum IP26]|uniref:Uncharacterized protein n=1 Tax=Sphingobium indicum F2 TaxID=1450518 RepID=A0A8E0WTU9_9SPHN|nr:MULTISPECIES: hypothetical protein [Sphingobium]EPR09748.1 hypothetical protein M527_06365 [Sphingobium indicum IP26]EQB03935.1 hypothetical protein L286_11270 [Sphingobium sp. HDIP04]KER37301.1 hypothetical protein AL00_06440 [Sphingobium indicum F2]
MGNVTDFPGVTRLPSDPARVIEHAAQAGLASVVIIGFKEDGSEYFRSSEADGGAALWHLERAKHKLITMPEKFSG